MGIVPMVSVVLATIIVTNLESEDYKKIYNFEIVIKTAWPEEWYPSLQKVVVL